MKQNRWAAQTEQWHLSLFSYSRFFFNCNDTNSLNLPSTQANTLPSFHWFTLWFTCLAPSAPYLVRQFQMPYSWWCCFTVSMHYFMNDDRGSSKRLVHHTTRLEGLWVKPAKLCTVQQDGQTSLKPGNSTTLTYFGLIPHPHSFIHFLSVQLCCKRIILKAGACASAAMRPQLIQ